MQKLAEQGVGTRPFFWGLHEQPVLRKYGFYKEQSLPICEFFSRKGFYLPSGLALNEEEIVYSAEKLKEILQKA
jgi:perosamine synthetase